VIQGRLLDVQGRPAPGVEGVVSTLSRGGQSIREPRPDEFNPARSGSTRGKTLPGWPEPAVTDAEGRFTVRGVGRGVRVTLRINDPRFALQSVEVDADGAPGPKQLTVALEPAQSVSGRITYADSGKPARGARIFVHSSFGPGRPIVPSEVRTDADGRFRANPSPSDRYLVTAYPPPDGPPYLSLSQEFDWPKGAVEHSVELALPRGISLSGKVIEEGSGKPVAGASLIFVSRAERQGQANSGSPEFDSASDGSFQLAASPSPHYLFAIGPSDDFVLQATDLRIVNAGRPGGPRVYSHCSIFLDLKPGAQNLVINVVLHRGVTVRGEILDPDGKLAKDTWMISRMIMPAPHVALSLWRRGHHTVARDGRFLLHGLDPDVETPVHFLDPKRKLAATALFSGKAAPGGTTVVRLAPCGTAVMRLVDPNGKPVKALRGGPWLISMVVTPGAAQSPMAAAETLADESDLPRLDPVNYAKFPAPDAQGIITFPALIPGASYRVTDRTTVRDASGPQVRKEFTVKAGETIDLGDIRIQNP
jgi:hypothetical protein